VGEQTACEDQPVNGGPRYPKAFIVGSPRSGTLWIKDILECSPLVVSGPESHLFPQLYAPLTAGGSLASRRARALERYEATSSGVLAELGQGPQMWIDRASLERVLDGAESETTSAEELAGRAVEAALNSFFFSHGGTPAHLLLEKTPDHVFYSEIILRRWPEAKIVEVLRDGRDVVASLGHMSWADATRREQIERWVRAVRHARTVRALPVAAGRWHVVRFEALKGDPRGEISRLFGFLDLPHTDEFIRDVAESTEFEAMRRRLHERTHRRRGMVGSWRDELSEEEVRLFNQIAGEVLVGAGYDLIG
jgi:hypothetical protein